MSIYAGWPSTEKVQLRSLAVRDSYLGFSMYKSPTLLRRTFWKFLHLEWNRFGPWKSDKWLGLAPLITTMKFSRRSREKNWHLTWTTCKDLFAYLAHLCPQNHRQEACRGWMESRGELRFVDWGHKWDCAWEDPKSLPAWPRCLYRSRICLSPSDKPFLLVRTLWKQICCRFLHNVHHGMSSINIIAPCGYVTVTLLSNQLSIELIKMIALSPSCQHLKLATCRKTPSKSGSASMRADRLQGWHSSLCFEKVRR